MSFIAKMFTPSKSDRQSGEQYNATYNATSHPLLSTTVDPSTGANVNQLGRAALISTSPQGVSGTDPTLKYRLLGNSGNLGN